MRFDLAAVFLFASWVAGASPFTINVIFNGGLTPSQQAVFTTAADTWMGLISGYQPDITIASLDITAEGKTIDGSGGILGSAGPTAWETQGSFTLATDGAMQFDSADLANLETNGTLLPVILHEMAHVMGFGTMWTLNSVYTNGTGAFTGAHAVAAYELEFHQLEALFVPVELEGGSGTANGHWDEVAGGSANTGVASSQGDRRFELMTGWLNSPFFISQTTIASFVDIGYATADEGIPEPGAVVLVGAGLAVLAWRRRGSVQ